VRRHSALQVMDAITFGSLVQVAPSLMLSVRLVSQGACVS
jgi:hypothetical protein